MAQKSGQRRQPVKPNRPARVDPGQQPTTSSTPATPTAIPQVAVITRQVGWVLLIARAFLSVVFLYAGISKIGDRSFLDDNSQSGIYQTLVRARHTSPIGSLLGPVEHHAFAFGVIFSIAEIAIGLGLLFGLFTRIAALGGMALSLSFFLTVSWTTTPWYTGADIGYLFALTPLVIGGSGGVYSLDGWLALASRRHPGAGEDRFRRALLGGAAGVGVLALLGIATLARSSSTAKSAGQRSADPTAATSPSGSGSGQPSGTSSGSAQSSPAASATGAILVTATEVAVGKGKQVTDPKSGDPAWVLQLSAGQFTALDAVCPHQQCTVGFVSASEGFACPCHGSRFAADGKLLQGPASRGLTSIPVAVVDGTVRLA